MGKKGSWLSAVKRAFRSPTKENNDKVRTSRRREDEQEQEEEEKKREKRRWIFRKPSSSQEIVIQCQQLQPKTASSTAAIPISAATVTATEQRHNIAMAVATTAAAEAAVVKAQAAVEVLRLIRPTNFVREHGAALMIQKAFRGYLARRAFRALKGLVRLQALVRGHNVRKQAKMTLQCMQALVRVQTRVRDQRMRLSQDQSQTSTTMSDSNSLHESRYLQDILDRQSISRDGSSIPDDWDDRPHRVEEIQAMLNSRKEASLNREKALAYAFSHQIWKSGRNPSFGNDEELEETPKGLDRWMSTKPWDSMGRTSTDQREHIRTVEVDTARPYSYLTPRRSQYHFHQRHHQSLPSSHSIASPIHRSHQNHRLSLHQSPITPSPSKTRPLQVRSASPRCLKEEGRNKYPAIDTPRMVSYYNDGGNQDDVAMVIPNYMAATESAKARIRSQSAPRHRPSTPERERVGSAKKRLSYPVPLDPNSGAFGEILRSPSRKNAHGGVEGGRGHHFGIEQRSNFSSCCTDSIGGENSPSSTSDLRRWLR